MSNGGSSVDESNKEKPTYWSFSAAGYVLCLQRAMRLRTAEGCGPATDTTALPTSQRTQNRGANRDPRVINIKRDNRLAALVELCAEHEP